MKRLAALLLVVVLAGVGCAYGGTPTAPAAITVNGTSVPRSQIEDELAFFTDHPAAANALLQMPVEGEVPGSYDPQAASFLLSLHTQAILLDQVRADLGGAVTDEMRAEAEQQLQSTFVPVDPTTGQPGDPAGADDVLSAMPDPLREVLVGFLVDRLAILDALEARDAPEITDADVEAFYEEVRGQLEETCISHVLVAFTDDQAQLRDPEFVPSAEQEQAALEGIEAAAARIEAGEDFAAVAEEVSDDTGSGAEGGVLGCGNPEQYVPEFAEAARTQPLGEVGDPVRTQFGYHLVLVTERGVTPIEDVEDQIRSQLEQERFDPQAALSEVLQTAATDATVRIDPRFGTWDPTDGGVVPPEGAAPPPTLAPPGGAPVIDPFGGDVPPGAAGARP